MCIKKHEDKKYNMNVNIKKHKYEKKNNMNMNKRVLLHMSNHNQIHARFSCYNLLYFYHTLICFIILIYNKRVHRSRHIWFDRSLSSVSKTKENNIPWQQNIYQNPYLRGSPYRLQKRYEVLLRYFAFNSVTGAMS